MSSADSAVWVYYVLESALAWPRGAYIGEAGKKALPYCRMRRCRWPKSQLSRSKTKGERLTCAKCGATWGFETYVEGISSGRHSTPPRSRDLFTKVQIGLCLKKSLTLWQQRVFEVYVKHEDRRAVSVAAECAKRWPRRVGGWSARIVRELLNGPQGQRQLGARARLERELASADLLETKGL